VVWYDNKHAVDKHMCTGGEGENRCDLEEEEEARITITVGNQLNNMIIGQSVCSGI
jgi:hypothetical protein